MEQLFATPDNKVIMYVGDHQADVQFARNLQSELGQDSTVISVAAAYSGAMPEQWGSQPDFIIRTPRELPAICEHYL
ncbi:putative phosphatase [Photobacterium gaetbulicola Gung47]|uniref:Putative phosphatase n=1 Tax=Photobacterium gaetbulicola Gung47 TaxID=658445 RepID=A0A0C5WUB1_9GAMM|nr:putative phosphatase [Photobacterium gaetbulicola Gung47]